MPQSEYMSQRNRTKKRIVGAIAVILLLIFTVLALLQIIDFLVWVILDLIVAGIANLLFRRLNN